MASNLKPAFAYTVAKSVDFYAKALGYNVHRLDESHCYRWGDLESGQTAIAFTPKHQHETDDLTGAVQVPKSDREPPMELCLVYSDVDAAFKVWVEGQRAEENGAVSVSQPEEKEWGKRVGYVRYIDGLTKASLSGTKLRNK